MHARRKQVLMPMLLVIHCYTIFVRFTQMRSMFALFDRGVLLYYYD